MTDKAKVMRILDITEEEYEEMKKADAEIDKGADPFPLDESQKKVEKKMRQADRAVNAYGKVVKRERKADNDKQAIVGRIISTLENWFQSDEHCTFNACTEINVINAEREIEFKHNGKKYKVVLSCPRS